MRLPFFKNIIPYDSIYVNSKFQKFIFGVKAVKILISASELKKDFDQYTIVDLRMGAAHSAGHIAGAISLPVGDPPLKDGTGFIDKADWAALLGNRGVSSDSKIVAYDDGTTGRAVARFWYIAKHYGHKDVFILNGGFGAAGGLPISSFAQKATPAKYVARTTPGYLFDIDQILENYDKITFLDTRTIEEFVGTELRGNPRGGHIRGAIFAAMDNFFADEAGQSFANPKKLAQTIHNMGVRKEDFIVAY